MLVEVACDGSCLGNNKRPSQRKAGAAAVFSIDGGTPYSKIKTLKKQEYNILSNQLAELTAFHLAVSEIKNKYSQASIKIYMDSMYVINIFTKWIYKWKANQSVVKHLSLILEIDSILNPLRSKIQLIYVQAHSGAQDRASQLNHLADVMAKDAAKSS